MSILEERGNFWWSDTLIGERETSPAASVGGVLKISDEGNIALDLDAPLLEVNKPKKGVIKARGVPIPNKAIYGALNNQNKRVCLFGLLGDSFLNRHFLANGCLIGQDKFPLGLIEPQFSGLGINMKGYEDWLCLDKVDRIENGSELTFTYKNSKDDKYKLEDGELWFTYHASYTYSSSSASLTPTAHLKYTGNAPLTAKDIYRKFRLIEDLFIILTDSEYCMEWPYLTLSDNGKNYQYYFGRSKSDAPPPERHQCCTTFNLLREDFGVIFSRWVKQSEQYGSGFYSYLSTRRGVDLYIENHFINLIGGLEALHRRKFGEFSIPSKLSERIKRILEDIALEKDKKWLEKTFNRIRIGEPNLSTRLFATLLSIPISQDKKKLQEFCDGCSKIRNDYAHFAGQREPNDNEVYYQDLNIKNHALSCLYHALILAEIGVNTEMIEHWFERSFSSFRIKSYLVQAELRDEPTPEATIKPV